MKQLFVILSLCMATTAQAQAPQEPSPWQVALTLNTDYISTSFGRNKGLWVTAKHQVAGQDAWRFHVGAAFQHHIIQESTSPFTHRVQGYTRDLGGYLLVDATWHPFAGRRLFITLEHFAGYTRLQSEGSLTLPDYGLTQTYRHLYGYFNYGVANHIGYAVGPISVQAMVWSSLKGFWDGGRQRPGDFDSRILAGVGIGYRF